MVRDLRFYRKGAFPGGPLSNLAVALARLFGSGWGARRRGSAARARERLTVMVVCDRAGLDRAGMERLKEEMAAVVARYVEVDARGATLEVRRRAGGGAVLVASFPLAARGGEAGRAAAAGEAGC